VSTTPATRRARALFSNLLLAGIATLVSLGLAEGVLRYARARMLSRPRVEYKMEPDTLLGWVKPASTVGIRKNDEYEVPESTNSLRLRGPEYPVVKPAGESRVLLLGDSFAEAYTVPFDSSFSEVMKRALNTDPKRPVQVLNSGTAGWSTDQELLYFRRDGRKLGADLVVLLFYQNDVVSNASDRYWRGRKPRFVLSGADDSTLVLQGVPVPAPAVGPNEAPPGEVEPGAEGDVEPQGPARRGLLERSLLFRQVRLTVLRNPSMLAMARALRLTSATEPLRPPPPNEWGVWLKSPSPRVEAGWRITQALLRALRREVEASGARFVVAHAPGREVIHPAFWAEAHRKFRIDTAAFEPGREEGELRRICDEAGLECVFLREPILKAMSASTEEAGEPLYWSRDSHWNARGNRMAGLAMADYLRASGPYGATAPWSARRATR